MTQLLDSQTDLNRHPEWMRLYENSPCPFGEGLGVRGVFENADDFFSQIIEVDS